MSYVALYRKFRPQTFSEVKGQDHVVRTLKNQIKNNRVGHAYLFTGTRGTGKTSVAKIMARALNCADPRDGEPCCECENCRAISTGSFMDVIEMDAASNNGVDDIRNLIEETRYTPAKGRYKVFIIDEAHMITKAAFNAFLKTLEEPPAYAVFILATTEPNKLPQTILSRVQRYDFRRIGTDTIKENLKELVQKEGAAAQDKALEHIARLGDGSMRDAVSLLDKCLSFSLGEELTYELVLGALGATDTGEFSALLRAVYSGDCAKALEAVDGASARGKDLSLFVTDFCIYLRNVLLTAIDESSSEKITGMSAESMRLLKEDAALVGEQILIRYIRILSELINKMRFSSVKRLLVEVELIKLARPQMETDPASLADRIRQLEAKIDSLPKSAAQETFFDGKGAQPQSPALSGESFGEIQKEEAAPFEESAAAAHESAASGFDWDEIVRGIPSVSLRVKLKKIKAQRSGGQIILYASSPVLKGIVEDALPEIKQALFAAGFDEETIVKKGTLDEDDEPDISDEELFKNIKYEITQEEF